MMTKEQFIEKLRSKLSKIPPKEVEDGIAFYSEMIDDRIEDGISEEEAVEQVGDVDAIASQIVENIPLKTIVKENLKPKRKLKSWEIVLIAVGSPIWLSLLVGGLAVVLSLFVSLWACVVTLWACEIAVAAVSVYGIIYGAIMTFYGDPYTYLAIIGLGVGCVGLAIMLCVGVVYVTKGTVVLTKKIILGIKNLFIKKKEA